MKQEQKLDNEQLDLQIQNNNQLCQQLLPQLKHNLL